MPSDDDDYMRFSWTLTVHACRVCLGRVVQRTGIGGRRIYRCTNCGTQLEAKAVSSLCCCGMKLRSGRDAGVRCLENPNPTPECPNEIISAPADLPAGVPAQPMGDEPDEESV